MNTILLLKRSRITRWSRLHMMKWSNLWLLILLLTTNLSVKAEQSENPEWYNISCNAGVEIESRMLYSSDWMSENDRTIFNEMTGSGCQTIYKLTFEQGCVHNDFCLSWDKNEPGSYPDSETSPANLVFFDNQTETEVGYPSGYGLNKDIVIYLDNLWGYEGDHISSQGVICYLGFKKQGDVNKPLYVYGTNEQEIDIEVTNDKLSDVSDLVTIRLIDQISADFTGYNSFGFRVNVDEFLNEHEEGFWFTIECDPSIEVVSIQESGEPYNPSQVTQLANGKKKYTFESPFYWRNYCEHLIINTKLVQQAPTYLNYECTAGVEIVNGGYLVEESEYGDIENELKAAGYKYIYTLGVDPGCSWNLFCMSWVKEKNCFEPEHSFWDCTGTVKLYDKDGYVVPEGQPGYPAGYTPNKDIAIYIENGIGSGDLANDPLHPYCYIAFKDAAKAASSTLYIQGSNNRVVQFDFRDPIVDIDGLPTERVENIDGNVIVKLFGEDECYSDYGDDYEGHYDYDYYYAKYGSMLWFTIECEPGYTINSIESNYSGWIIRDASKNITEVTPDGRTIYRFEWNEYDNLCLTFFPHLSYQEVSPELHFVDLGLPSGTKWCKFNVDATSPRDKGNFYAWGETTEKSTYTWKNYKYCSGTATTCKNIGDDISKTDYDIAYSLYKEIGGQIPTADQWNELITLCKWDEVGFDGYTVTGPNGQSIFLPFSGCSYDGKDYGKGTYAYYWTANNVGSNKSKAQAVCIKEYTKTSIVNLNRRTGVAIRPVMTPPVEQNDIELVDLGLSVKWGNQNLGAANESAYGDYYAWGETEAKSTYTWKNYKYANGSAKTARNIGADISQTDYDAANLSNEALAMPTTAQWNELIERCTWKETTVDGIKGYRVTGPSGKSIFLPLSGCSYDGKQVSAGASAYYWTSGNYASDVSKAQATYLKSGAKATVTAIQRRTGAAIRPVECAVGYVDLNLSSGNLWATSNVGASSEEQVGNYYAWGEVAPKSNYTWKNYLYANGTAATVQNIGKNICGNTTYDPAMGKQVEIVKGDVNYTYESQMPSYSDFEELYYTCDYKEETVNGVKGLRFSNNGKSIFLPYTGSWYDGKKHDVGASAFYWSGDINSSNNQQARTMSIKGGNANFVNCQRRTGLNIRPVFVIKRAYANSGGFDTDGINTIQQTTSQDDAIYNLQGIKVQGELKPGIYIQNGKKFVVK